MSAPHPAPHPAPNSPWLWLGLALVLIPVCVRATSLITTLPYWDIDPGVSATPLVGLGVWGSMLVDALTILGAGLLLLGSPPARGRSTLVLGALALLGCASIAWHGWLGPWCTIQHQRVGLSWASGVLAAQALHLAGRDRRVLAGAGGVLLGVVVVLGLKGLSQYFFEHAILVESYRHNADTLLAAQGWTPGSSSALAYERRLMQNEATGWWGFANVLASFAALGLAGFAGVLAGALQGRAEHRGAIIAIAGTGAVLSLVTIVLAGSKGGVIVALIVAGLLAGAIVRARGLVGARLAGRVLSIAGPALVCLTLVGVIVRGVLGERLGELSLLFRWFYLQGATRIALGDFGPPGPKPLHALVGVGPDGFKDAYLTAKPPISPEEVASPHSIFFDWWSCLGLLGLAWVALALWWLWRASREVALQSDESSEASASEHTRTLGRFVTLAAACATIVALLLEREALTPEAALVRIVGLIGWIGAGWAAAVVLTRSTLARAALGIGVIALWVHAQIEVTASNVQSAPLALMLLGLVSAASRPPSVSGTRVTARLLGAGTLALGGLVIVAGVVPAWRWENTLAHAAEQMHPVAELRAALTEPTPDRARAILRREFGDSPLPLGEQIGQLHRRSLAGALNTLALANTGADWRMAREIERLRFALGELTDHLEHATQPPVMDPRDWPPWAAGLWHSRVQLLAARLERGVDHDARALLSTLVQAQRADPGNLPLALRHLRLLVAHRELGSDEDLRAQARRVLELDENQRLDRAVKGLSAADRDFVRGLIGP